MNKIRKWLFGPRIFYAYFETETSKHFRMTLVLSGKTTNRDLFNWTIEVKKEIEESKTGVVMRDFKRV